ncbi:hypothetical protein K525DRAFT_187860 [Schizophyllum commune Loenen D]|nr:hypothetical protein K525DRAFT_187860 [Schizophyllum commune Loenen D]
MSWLGDLVNHVGSRVDAYCAVAHCSLPAADLSHAKSTPCEGRTSTRNPQQLDCFINRLPNELLCTIFMMCGVVDNFFLYPRYVSRDEYPPPMLLYSRATVLLGHVCRRWFAVTRCYPQLWTMVDVSFPQPADVDTLKLCIRYSKGLPLTLRINGRHWTPLHLRNTDAYRQFMRLVASVSHRWVEISVVVTQTPFEPFDGMNHLTDLPVGAFPLLERAMLYFMYDYKESSRALWERFFSSPALRTIHWRGVGFRAPSSVLEQLTHVAVDRIDPADIMDFLRSSKQLEFLRVALKSDESLFAGTDDGAFIARLSTPVDLPRMQVLMLSGMYNMVNLLDCICVPLLRRLDLTSSGVQAHAVEGMLQRSRAQLTMLGLRRMYKGHIDQTTMLLQSLPLRHLSIFLYEPYPPHGRKEIEPFDPRPYLPPYLILFTHNHVQADTMYWETVANVGDNAM